MRRPLQRRHEPAESLIASARRRSAGLALAGALTAALAGVLLWPAHHGTGPSSPGVRALLVDASASVARRRPGRLREVRDELLAQAGAARASGEEVLVIVFAEDVVRALGPAPVHELELALRGDGREPLDTAAPTGRDGATRLADALELARRVVLEPERAQGRVVLLGDGTYTGREPASELAALARADIPIDLVRPGESVLPDAALIAVELPPRVEEGAPLGLSLHYRLEVAARAAEALELTAEVRMTDGSGNALRRVRAQLPPPPYPADSAGAVVPLGPAPRGRVVCTVRLELRDARGLVLDPVPENDAAVAASFGGDARALGVLAPQARGADARALGSAIEQALEGLEVQQLAPDSLTELAQLDALLLLDPSSSTAPRALLEAFVAEGGGLFALLGWGVLEEHAFAPGDDPLELLPLAPISGPSIERDVILLVDGSGSMEGEPIEAVRRAAAELVAAAPAGDEVRLQFFTARLEPGSTLLKRSGETAIGRADALERALGAHVPRGATQIVASLEQLADARERADREALVLLLSDGRESTELLDAPARASAVRERLAAAGARLAVVAAGPRVELALLEVLSGPAGQPARAEDLSALAEILRREVNRERVREGQPLVLHALSPAGPDDPVAALLGGAPPVARRVLRAEARGGAELLWIDAEGEPVLASWRVGRGRVAALATESGEAWAPSLLDGIGSLGPLVRALARGRERAPLRARIAEGRLVVEGEGQAFAAGCSSATVSTARGAVRFSVQLSADPVAPTTRLTGSLPVHARFQPSEPLVVVLEGGGAAVLEHAAADEWLLPPRRAFGVPAAGGGGAAGRGHGAGARGPHPAAVPVLVSALALLFAAGFARSGRPPQRGRSPVKTAGDR